VVRASAAAHAARAKGIKIYAIGVGTPEGAPIPVYRSGEKEYLRDQMGNVVLAKVDEDTLRGIADTTGGRYFIAKDERALGDVYDSIAGMEKKELTVKRIKGYTELFPYFAGAGLLFLAVGGVLGAGRLRVLS